jgi:hypothetical protein
VKKLFLVLLLVVVLGPLVAWKLQGDRELSVTIVDASVTDEARTEHAGLIWLLSQMRIRKPGGAAYSLDDYFGYFPGPNSEVRRVTQQQLANTDLLYLADARGVWQSDLERFEMMRDPNRDQLLHSGFNAREIDAIARYIRDGGIAVGECMLFYANHGGERGGQRLAQAFGVRWTGWIGAWFKDMSNVVEVPFWLRALYEQNTGQNWPYRGPGIIFVNRSQGKFVVLTPGIELRTPRPDIIISQRRGVLDEAVESGVPIWGWFEVVEASDPTTVHAMIRLELTGAGEKAMSDARLPYAFPAVVAQLIDRNTYYLAADLGRVSTWLGPAKIKWIPGIRKALAGTFETHLPGEHAFWRFYIPLLTNLLEAQAR